MAAFAAFIGGEDEGSGRESEGPAASGDELAAAIRGICELLPAAERRDIELCEVAR